MSTSRAIFSLVFFFFKYHIYIYVYWNQTPPFFLKKKKRTLTSFCFCQNLNFFFFLLRFHFFFISVFFFVNVGLMVVCIVDVENIAQPAFVVPVYYRIHSGLQTTLVSRLISSIIYLLHSCIYKCEFCWALELLCHVLRCV